MKPQSETVSEDLTQQLLQSPVKITYKLSASQMWLIDISIIVDNWIRKMSQDGFLEELNVEGGCFSQYDHVLKAIERLEETSLWLNRAIKKSHE